MKSSRSPVGMVTKALLQWWWLIAVSVAIGAGVGYFIRSKQPNVYWAHATVLFDQRLAQGGQISNVANIQEVMSVYSGLVRREKMLLPVIDKLQLNMSVDQLNERMIVQPVKDLPLLEILVSDTDPSIASNISNAIAQEMIDQSPAEQLTADQEFKRAQLSDLQAQIETAQNAYNDLIAQGSTLTSAFEIAQNTQQQNSTLQTVRDLQALYADLSAGIDDKSGLLSIFEPATAQTAIAVTGSMLSIVLSAAGGLVLSILTIVVITYLDDRLDYQEGIEGIDGVRVLGPLGLIPRSKLPLYVATMSDSIESEVLRQIRAKLVLLNGGTPPKVLTVTSYDSGDGKTVTAANLALVAAQTGMRTLLVDGDIRKGDAHEIFELPNVMGLSDILASRENPEVLLSRSVLESGYDNLSILTSGRSTADPASLVGSPRFEALVQHLRDQFEIVIMDSVPTIGGPDSAFVAEVSDGVIIVIHAQRTTHRALTRTLQTLRQGRDVNIYGMVFNRIALQMTPSHYQPYYRRTMSINPAKLSKELQQAEQKHGLFAFRRNIAKAPNGELMYSLSAASIQLGISEKVLVHWVTAGYLQAERHGYRRWIRQSEIDHRLDQLPRSHMPVNGELGAALENDQGQPSTVTDVLRTRRDALLEYAREAQSEESDS